MIKLSDSDGARFWSKVRVVNDDECWLWLGARNRYGIFWLNGKYYGAHRLALSLVRFVPDNLFVLHSCDVPLCVNPNHLRLGTHADNMNDVVQRGRFVGEHNGNSMLEFVDVENIRVLCGFCLQREIADIYNVAQGTISRIISGTRWHK